MSKLEFVNNHLKNAKINNAQLSKICYFFAQDYNASQTAKELGLSRQTINSYYKMIREALLEEQESIDSLILENNFSQECYILKYFSLHNHIIYYIEYNSKPYLLNSNNSVLSKISEFVELDIKDSLINHKRANAARILYDIQQKQYMVSSYLKSSNELEEFITQRLKKFRGLNKNNILNHINESIIRFENTNNSIYNTLQRIFNITN